MLSPGLLDVVAGAAMRAQPPSVVPADSRIPAKFTNVSSDGIF